MYVSPPGPSREVHRRRRSLVPRKLPALHRRATNTDSAKGLFIGYIRYVEHRPTSTREIRERLVHLLADVDSQLVSGWLKDPRENRDDVGETVGLMLQVVASLMGEIDVFIGSVDTPETGEPASAASTGSREVETELVDLVSDEPIASLLEIEAPFHLAEGPG